MKFEYYHSGLDSVPKLSVDGTVQNSIHFSHWQGNGTPSELKADTSTEIAINLVKSANREQFTGGIQLVTNNHFDTDGVLSVWTILNDSRALELRDCLVPAAETGDFSEFTNEDAIRASIVIQGSDQPTPHEETGSPLARQLAGAVVDDDGRAYELVLPEVERVLTRTNEYESLWQAGWRRIADAVESFERGSSQVTGYAENGISLVLLAPEVFGDGGFDATRHAAPYIAISRYARGDLFVITTPVKGGWIYRIDYPYYSWAETVVRPRIQRRDLTSMLARLNQLEAPGGKGFWKSDSRELTSAAKFLDQEETLVPSELPPEKVIDVVRENFSLAYSSVV
jgi:hypothetical protein